MVQQRLEPNCKTCEFRKWDGTDNVCTAHFDGFPGHPFVKPEYYVKPNWCPLSNPQRVTREEVENAIHPTIRASIAGMYLKNGDKVPERLCDPVQFHTLPKGDQ